MRKLLANPAPFFAAILAAYLVLTSAHAAFLNKTVYGDGIFYFSWLRSMVFDGDASFTDEYAHFGVSQPILPSGKPGNKYAIGPAILWSPAYLSIRPIVQGDGYGFPYQTAVAVISAGYAVTGLFLLYRLLSRFVPGVALNAAVFGLAFATNLVFYGGIDTVNSHPVEFFAVSLFLALLFQRKRSWIAIGFALGIIGTIRPQDLVWSLAVIPVLGLHNILPLTMGFLAGMAPQLVAWTALNGSVTRNPYLTGYEGFSFLHPHIDHVLFSGDSGFFTYTPIALAGIAGFFVPWEKPLAVFKPYFAVILGIQIYIIASWSSYTQGASYSGRMLVGTLPVVLFGLTHLYAYIQRRFWKPHYPLWIVSGAFGLLNCMMILNFLLTRP